MQRAVEVHLDKARLKAAKRLVYAGMHAMSDVDAATVAKLKKFLTDCDALLRLASPESSKVNVLVRDIEGQLVIPDWFKNDVQICYRWYQIVFRYFLRNSSQYSINVLKLII